MRITFDPSKRDGTPAERGLDFADAAKVFAEPHFDQADERQDYGEVRIITVGYLAGRMVIVVWTPSGDDRRRPAHHLDEEGQ